MRNGTPVKGRWGGVNDLGGNGGSDLSEKIIAASPIPPTRRDGSFHLLKDDGGGLAVMTAAEKISLQVLYPHAPARIVPSTKRTMGLGQQQHSTISTSAEKNYRCRSLPP